MALIDNLKSSESGLFDAVTKLDNDWQELRTLVQHTSYHVFYILLGMDHGCPCDDFRFEIRQDGTPVVIQRYQNGSHVEPYPNAEFSYPLKWILDSSDSNELFDENDVDMKDDAQ